uniref:Uncharacterized protein n=1 Tax=Ananas comosus var. bracteatus TaxID=296719 RepID=A0A6V7Q1R5_ANACO|nr:unnamed protein product [Ananas comosus var. bracteatus]
MAAVVVQICFRDFLRIVCQRFSVSAPVYRIPIENERLLSVYVEVKVPKGETVTEVIHCWGMPCSTVDETVEDAACRAVARLRDEFGFEVKDSNLEEKKFFENLYERVSADYSSLRGKYKRLKCDYNLLKGYYSSFLAEKECFVISLPPPSFFPPILTLFFFFLHAGVFDFVRVCTSLCKFVSEISCALSTSDSMSAPVYEIPVENEGLLSVYVEVEVPKGETVAEAIRCWGMPYSTVDETEEDAACRAIARLRDEFGFEVKDSNLEPK